MIRFSPNFSSLTASLTRRRVSAQLTAQLAAAEKEVGSGRKADIYKSLGLGSARVLDLRAAIDRTEGFLTANAQLGNRLDTMAEVMGNVRATAQQVLSLAVSNRDRPTQTAVELQMSARAALDSIVGQMNTSYQGAALFGGIETDGMPLRSWSQVSPDSGLSPQQVMEAILAGGLANATQAAAKAGRVTAAFKNASTVPARNFDATFYGGAAQTGPRQSARIDETGSIAYGVQANDPAYRAILQGLSMLAVTDVSKISDEATYAAWTQVAVDALATGVTQALAAETVLGTQQARLAETVTAQESRQLIYKNQVLDLEGVDQYEAASRISLLEAQLQASYAVSARLSNLSYVYFME